MKINFKKNNKTNSLVQKKGLGLYIHIPFCMKKCDYCDFLSAPASDEIKKQYVEAVMNEIESYKQLTEDYTVKTIFIGGGTPSCIEEAYIEQILKAVYDIFKVDITSLKDSNSKDCNLEVDRSEVDRSNIEITIEVNPGTITLNKLKTYKKSGINRLSFGLQSTDNEELKLLGRIHTYEEFKENYKLTRKVGFDNINIDLMSALPNQTIEKWTKTLEEVIALQPEHISAYSLIIEEGTPFYERYNGKERLLPSEDVDRKMYDITKKILGEHGYYRYEISNYAKPGLESRHNSSYWRRVEYLGIGLGASSYINNQRFHNTTDINEYIKNSSNHNEIRKDMQRLVEREQMEEFMFLGLRMSEGVSKEEFKITFNTSIEIVYGEIIHKLSNEGLLRNESDRIYLTDRGIDISNYVLSEFLFDDFVRC